MLSKQIRFSLYLFLLISVLGCEKSDCGAFTVTFNGTVIDNSSVPIDGVDVKISVNSSEPSSFTITDNSGNFSKNWYRQAPLGVVTLTFTKMGFQPFTTEPKNIGLNCSDEVVETNLTLHP